MGNPSAAPAPVRRKPNNPRPAPGPGRRPNAKGRATGGGAGLDAHLANEDPFNAYLSSLSGAGINPWGADSGYSNWLQTDAYDQYEAAYYQALQASPKKALTRQKFNQNYITGANPAFSQNAYRPTHIQNNPRDYYNQQATAAGWNIHGSSPYERYLRGEGWNNNADQYGQATIQNPGLRYMDFMQPNAFVNRGLY